MNRLAVLAAALACACAPTRYLERSPVWDEHDALPIARPAENTFSFEWNFARDLAILPVDRFLALDYGLEAANVNALDEVPDSTWFHDPRRDSPAARIRPRELTTQEMVWGAASEADVPVPPLTITKGKTVGATHGFIAKDARGVRYMIKFDPPGRAGFATAVEIVVSRLAWACGWRVPAEMMTEVPVDALRLAPNATTKNAKDVTVPFREADLARLLSGVDQSANRPLLVLASRWLPGVGVGPFRYFGRRRDDANDHYPHENRRELRGFGIFSAWVNNTDTYEGNTLDSYQGEPGRGHLVHYQQDVGGSFDNWGFAPKYYWIGHETWFSIDRVLRSLLTLGLWPAFWEGDRYRTPHEQLAAASPALGGFGVERFDPKTWHPVVPNPAFSRQTARDRYWGAKRIALINERELRAAISAGRYRPEVAEHLFEILWERRQRVLRTYLAELSSLDHFFFDGPRLCFDDLWVSAGLGGASKYEAREGAGPVSLQAGGGGQDCVAVAPAHGYRVLELRVTRPGMPASRPVRVHFTERDGARQVLGIER